VRLWEVATGRECRQFQGHNDQLRAVTFSPDGKAVAAANYDGVVRLWDVATGRQRTIATGTPGPVVSLVFSPDGKWLSLGPMGMGNVTLGIWDAATGKEKHRLPDSERGPVAFSPDGHTLISALDTVRFWDAATGRLLRKSKELEGMTLSLAFSPDGKTLATGGGNQTVSLWEVATARERVEVPRTKDQVTFAMMFTPDGKILAWLDNRPDVHFWDVQACREIRPDTEPR
jgi:WD40 repeat protein